jgi:acyl-CoA-binding protein
MTLKCFTLLLTGKSKDDAESEYIKKVQEMKEAYGF